MTRSGGAKQTQHQQQPPPVVVSANGSFQGNQTGTEFFDLQRDAGNRLVGEWLKKSLRNSTPPVIQTKSINAGSTEPAEQQADNAAQQVTRRAENGAPARSLIVEDDAQSVQAGQMRKSEFLSQLRTATNRAAEETLAGTMWSSLGCPYIERWFSHYEGQSAQHVERAIQKYTPEARGASNARDYIPAVTNRLRRGIEQWRETGVVPADAPAELAGGEMPGITAGTLIGGLVGGALSAVGSAVSSVGRALFKEREGGAAEVTEPEAIRAQLGSGRSLDGTARSRMEPAFGANFSSVRVHTDAKAQQLSNSLNARAFTIGTDIAFGAGEYNPGTLVGDALIAHELAHVAQQQGGDAVASPMQKQGGTSSTFEEDADTSAVRAVVGMWGWSKMALAHAGESAMPALKSGLRLQRCSKNVSVRSPGEVDKEFKQVSQEIVSGLPSGPAREQIESDLSRLWMIYGDEMKAAGSDAAKQAEIQRNLSDSLARFKESAPLQVDLTKRYGITFAQRESGRIEKTKDLRQYFRAWSLDELKVIDKVLAAVPAEYLKNIRKIERSPAILDPSLSAEGSTPTPHSAAAWKPKAQTLEIYDLFFRAEEFQKPGLLLHEIGHSTVTDQDPKKTGGFTSLPPPDWMVLSDWKTSTVATLKTDLKISDKEATELVKQLTKNKQTQRRIAGLVLSPWRFSFLSRVIRHRNLSLQLALEFLLVILLQISPLGFAH